MKRIFTYSLVVLLLSLSVQRLAAQNIGTYIFSPPTTVTFTPLSGSTTFTVNGGGGSLDDGYSAPITIPFTFNFGGSPFTTLIVTTNGAINFGVAPTGTTYAPLSGADNNVFAFIARDLNNTSAIYSYITQGSSPNRIFIIEALNFWRYGAATELGNAQVWLYETTNAIEIHYGAFATWSAGYTCQVGLRGTSTAAAQILALSGVAPTTWTAPVVTNLSTATMDLNALPTSGLMYRFSPPPPCATPSAQPTALILTPSTTSINGSFTASASADSYLIIRSLSSTLGATPVDGTVYTVGSAFGGGIVNTWGSSTTFTSTGLTPNTPYYYYIFAANNLCLGTPPMYRTASPLLGNTSTLPIFPISGNKTIGPTGDFFTLTAAFAYLNSNGVNGALNLILQSTYVSSVEPAFPIPVLSIPGASSTNKVVVYPSVTGLSITSASATGTINMNGATYVTFDGRVNAIGSTKDMVIENTSLTGYAIQFVNDAVFNGFQYCIVKSVNTGAVSGTIYFGSTTGTTGNDNNVIDNCELRDGATPPLNVIFGQGSTVGIPLYNSGNTISNCMIHDWYAPSGGNPVGIYLNAGCTQWTIANNSFYQTVPRSPTLAVGYNIILLVPGDGYAVTGNYFGGSAPNCGGAPWTLNGNGTPPTIANFIYCIRFQTGVLFNNPNSVQGNTIANIALATNPAAASIYFTGLIAVSGILNVGDITPNIVGSATGTGSISITVGNGAFAAVYEGLDFRSVAGNVKNNVVGSITLSGSAGSASTSAQTFRAIGITPTTQIGPVTVSGNLVGSLTTAGSIQTPAQTNPPMILQGLVISSTGTSTMTVTNNTCANWTNQNAYVGASSYCVGIQNAGSTVPSVITSNTIRDITCTAPTTTLTNPASIMGILSTNSFPGNVIRQNNIYNLTNTSAAASVAIHGIYISSAGGSMLCEKNFIHSFSMPTTSATALMTGININSGSTYIGAYKNNMVRLGINGDGTPMGGNCIINGIYEQGTATYDSILHNSVYIGGTVAAGVTGSTYAFNSIVTPLATTWRVYLNNIFFNARSGGTTGEHYGIKMGGTTQFPVGTTCGYNLIFSNGAVGAMFGSYNALDVTSLGNWKIATGNDIASGSADPNFIAPVGNAATVNLHVQSPTPIEASGTALFNVTDDFDLQARIGLTPTDVGADAGNFTLSADVFGPNIVYAPLGNGNTANRVLTNFATITDNVGVSGGLSLPRIYYKLSTDANAFVGNLSSNNGWKYVSASNSSSPYNFTIDYSIINGGSVSLGNIIQYFVVAQDAANNLNSFYPGAGASGNPPVQNINLAPTIVQSYTIVGSIATTITVPGTYSTLTATGGAFDAINNGTLVGNTTINIAGDLTEPGTVALNEFAQDSPGSNYTLTIKPDATTLRNINGTAVASGTAMIRFNGADRVIIDGGAGKYLTFRNTNATASSAGPTIQYLNGANKDTLRNCTIENNGTSTSYGGVNIGATQANLVVITGNDIRDATAGTVGPLAVGIYSAYNLNTLRILNNNIYNWTSYGCYLSAVNDGAIITGNNFYQTAARTSVLYGIYLLSNNGHLISNNNIGGSNATRTGAAMTTSTNIYGIYLSVGTVIPSSVQGNFFSRSGSTGASGVFGVYVTAGSVNIGTVTGNTFGGAALPTDTIRNGYDNGIIYTSSSGYVNIANNTISNVAYYGGSGDRTAAMYIGGGSVTIVNNIIHDIKSNATGASFTYLPTGIQVAGGLAILIEKNTIYNVWNSSPNLAALTATGIEINTASNNVTIDKNKIYNIYAVGLGTAAASPTVFGIYTLAAISYVYDNLISIGQNTPPETRVWGIQDLSSSATSNNAYSFNAIYVNGVGAGSNSSYAFQKTSTAVGTLMNNIFYNSRAGGTIKSYAIGITNVPPTIGSDYNDLYSTGSIVGQWGAADVANYATWKTTTLQDGHSVSVDPLFPSLTDWHTTKPEMNNAGLTIAGITTDYAGTVRGTPPDIGAYEFALNPIVTTVAATGITGSGATVNGSVNAQGEIVATSFEYGLTTGYGSTIAASPASIAGSVTTTMNAAIGGLQPLTLYHYRAKGVVNATPYVGVDMTFTTLAIPPTVVTTAAIPVAGTTATVNGTVNANNSTTTVSFDYGLTILYGTNVPGVPVTVNGSIVTPVLANLTGLLPCTIYHYRVNGVNAGGTANGNDLTFTTTSAAPFATTLAASGIGTTTATMNGSVTANCLSTTVTFNYGLTTGYGSSIAGTPSPLNGNIATPVSASLSGLNLGATYHYQVCATNASGTTCGGDQQFTTGCPQAGPAGPITGPVSTCQGGSGYVYTVAPIANATGYAWTLPVGGIITGGINTNTITVSYGPTALSGYVFVYGTALCGNGSPSQLLVTINPPAAPSIAGPANVCVGSTGNVYTTQSGMTNYTWTVSAGGTITAGGGPANNTVTVSWTTAGAKTVCVNYNSAQGCPALAPVCYNVTVNPLPVPTISGPNPSCTNVPGVVYTTQTGMNSYIWTTSAGGTITAGLGTDAVTVLWTATGAQTVSVNYTNSNGCTAAAPTAYPVTVNATTVPTITGSSSLCVNSGYYYYSTQAGMTNYVWTVSGGSIIAGQGTNTLQVSWPNTGVGSVCVNFTNPAGCSVPSPTCMSVTVNPLPDAAGGISGTLTVCAGQTGVAYSVLPIPNALTYVWTLPAGATIASGAGTNLITVDFAANASSGNITVYGNNTCGNGTDSPPFPVTVTQLPGDAGIITGSSTVCIGSTGVLYSVLPIANATGYGWTTPPGTTISGGMNTNSITVDYGPAATSGTVTVVGMNSCGSGTVSPDFAVTVSPIPPAPVLTPTDGVLAGDTIFSSAPSGNQWYLNGVLIPGATGPYYITDAIGVYTDIVTVNGCSSDASNGVNAYGVGIPEIQSGTINIFPIPNDGLFKLSINSQSYQTFNLSVYNYLGVIIYEQKNIEVKGLSERMIDLRPIPNGVYSVVLKNNEQQIVRKIVINK